MGYPVDLGSIESTSPLYYLLIIGTFAVIGFGLKYIDEAVDEERFNKKKAMLVAPIVVVLWAGLSLLDSVSAVILFSILFAVLLSGKVDNVIFKLSSISLVAVFFLIEFSQFSWVPFVLLTTLGVADEEGNDYVDKHKAPRFGKFFFAHRCAMKVGILGLCAASFISWFYLIAFLAFDTAYEALELSKYMNQSFFGYKIKQFQQSLLILKKVK